MQNCASFSATRRGLPLPMTSSASYMLDIQVSRAAGGDRKRDDLRENTLQLMLEQLKRLAASRPCLLVIEDLQWIDPTSRELLEAIVQLAADLSLFVLITSRPSPAEESMIAAFGGKTECRDLSSGTAQRGAEFGDYRQRFRRYALPSLGGSGDRQAHRTRPPSRSISRNSPTSSATSWRLKAIQ